MELFGELVPDRKIPERVVESIVDHMKGGAENPFLPALLKLDKFDVESLVGLFNSVMEKQKPAPYVTRYPNISVEEVLRKFSELYSRKVYSIDDRFEYFFIHGLGYNKQDFEEIILGKEPQLFRSDGSIDFQEASRVFGFNREFMRRWKQLETCFNEFESIKSVDAEPRAIDWNYWREHLGDDAIQVHQQSLDDMIRKVPIFPVEMVIDTKKTHLDPIYDQIKDEVIDELPYFEKMVEQDVRMGEFHEHVDKYGDISLREFLEKYHPEIRNEIDLEIENENWDFEYQEELRAVLEGKTLADFITTKEELKEFTESRWDEILAEHERSQITGTTALEKVMKEFAKAQDDLKRAEAEVAGMKGGEDRQEEESGQGGQSSTEEKQEEVDRESKEQDPFRFVVQKYLTEMYNLESDYFEKQAARDREAREKAAAEKAAAEKAAAELAASSKKKK